MDFLLCAKATKFYNKGLIKSCGEKYDFHYFCALTYVIILYSYKYTSSLMPGRLDLPSQGASLLQRPASEDLAAVETAFQNKKKQDKDSPEYLHRCSFVSGALANTQPV